MSLKLFSHTLTGKAAIALITDKAVQTTKVFDHSDFGRWTHLVKIESDIFEKNEKLFLYNQYKRNGAIGKLTKTGFAAESTFEPGSFGGWSHITAIGSLLFFYNQETREGAVATTAPQTFKVEKLDLPKVPITGQLSPNMWKATSSPHTESQPANPYFATVTTYAPDSFSKWTHVVASGAYL
ncbi:MAG: hypothetical protein KDF65_15640, partial [Anaerolineae bacterium]|nr:hypothetical protein [Anaerolineae bacterium]